MHPLGCDPCEVHFFMMIMKKGECDHDELQKVYETVFYAADRKFKVGEKRVC